MTHFFERRDRWGHGMALWVVLAMLFLAPLGWWGVRQIRLENDVENWLPEDDPQARVFAWYRSLFPSEERLLVTWEGSSLDDPRVEALARRLRGVEDAQGIRRHGSPYIAGVVTPQDAIDRMTRRDVEYADAVERLRGVLLSADGSPVALSVALSEAGAEEKPAALAAIRAAADEVGIAEADLRMGGQPVAGTELNRAIKRAAWNREAPLWQFHRRSPVLLSALVAVVLAVLMLRSVHLTVLVLAATFYTTFLALAVVPVTGGSMNMVLVVMPTLLMVITLSAAIHLANYWKHAAHENLRTAVPRACRMAFQPCLLASVTTAIGLASLGTSPLVPVRDFGIYSAVGTLISFVMVLYGLPALLQFWPASGAPPKSSDGRTWRRLAGRLVRHRMAVQAGCLAAFVGTVAGLAWFRTETKAIRYFPEHARVVQDYNYLEEHLAGIVPVEVILRIDADAQRRLDLAERVALVRDVQDRLRAHPEISGTISLADFLQTAPTDADATTVQKALHHRRLYEIEDRLRGGRAEADDFYTVATAPDPFHDTPETRLSETGDELWRVTAQVALMSDMDYGTFLAELEEIAREAISGQEGVGHVVTGLVPLFLRTQQAVLESLILSFGLAFAIIAVVMMVLLRHPLSGLFSMLPNLFPVGVVFGLVSWAGMPVDMGTMITASVALGIAVDGTLHLLTWFWYGVERGLPRGEAIARALAHCGPAMWQTSAIIALGLLMLWPVDLLLVSRFGWLMAALIAAALFGDVILLPALLAGPMGTIIERTVARRSPIEPPASPPPRPHLRPVAVAQAGRGPGTSE